ncbi:MAG: lytic transglycosylase domain-containing protein [Deltaproteobacteria bacterium]
MRLVLPLVMLALHLFWWSPAAAQYSLLKEIIIQRNLAEIQKSLKDGSYKGEEGILKIKPEAAKSLGLKTVLDRDYLDAKELLEQATSSLEAARGFMATRDEETYSGEHVRNIGILYLHYRRSLEKAKEKFLSYRAKLDPVVDERLQEAACSRLMDKLLSECFKRSDNRLRDGLGLFYNLCRDPDQDHVFLNSENMDFVNEVFHRFATEYPADQPAPFLMDRQEEYRNRGQKWKEAIQGDFPYADRLEEAIMKLKPGSEQVDPLLFVALMRKESNFDPQAVSSSGAAGLTQLMPRTAMDLGMKNVWMPAYFHQAAGLSDTERRTRAQAMAALHRINEDNKLQAASEARDLMQEALRIGQQKEKLYAQYRRELLLSSGDDRLEASLAMEYGLKYFLRLMKDFKGDVSLALAAYNAGPQRVKEYKGIPPFGETIRFRNRILEFYREYLKKAKGRNSSG